MTRVSCFKAYDIRGKVDVDLTEEIAFFLGHALVTVCDARRVVVGFDIRASSPRLADALARGLQAAGCDVLDIGLCGTEEVYFATDHLEACAGVMVTASHNPNEYNGFKLVGRQAAPLPDATFRALEAAVATRTRHNAAAPGRRTTVACRDAYVERVLSFIDATAISPMHILANAGNGAAGPTFDAVVEGLLAQGAPLRVTRQHHTPDARFPNGIPNPLLPENQPMTAGATRQSGADLGIAWDGDFDRCFFFDETGAFIAGEYIVGVLAEAVLRRDPGAAIVHDPRVMWNTQRVVSRAGGQALLSRTGHALVKARMRETNAAYGGEMSAHHYFRDFMFCDSGMIPWLLMLEHLSVSGASLSQTIAEMRRRHPSSGEINFRVADADAATQAILARYKAEATDVDWLDGLSLSFATWRLNLRQSNTEPLLRLNVETLGDAAALAARTVEISDLIEGFQAAA